MEVGAVRRGRGGGGAPVRPRRDLLEGLSDDVHLRVLGRVALLVDGLKELADPRLPVIVHDDDPLDHPLRRSGARARTARTSTTTMVFTSCVHCRRAAEVEKGKFDLGSLEVFLAEVLAHLLAHAVTLVGF